ncbi:MAG: hypothetical protein IPQ09_03395 [Myxococcales bacterium]|nr:hypothetical protein [Myxococcales bacterium]
MSRGRTTGKLGNDWVVVGLAALACIAGLGCNDAVAKAREPSGPPPAEEGISFAGGAGARERAAPPPVTIVTPERPAPAAVGALENLRALRRLYEGLGRLEDGTAREDVRIVQFGDSHTAADLETGTIRRALTSRFGDGGRGYVQIGRPWKSYAQEGVRTGMTDFIGEHSGPKFHGRPGSEGLFGLGGGAIATDRRGARAWAELSARANVIELSYLQQPAGGSFDFIVDNVRVARVQTRGVAYTAAFRAVPVADGPHTVEVRALGDGDVRVYGLTLDASANGVTVDALGINGARATALLAWNEPHVAEQLRRRTPDLVVLAYGTNESGDDATPERYERHLVDALSRVKRAVPSASCLLLGPPDRAIETKDGWITSPKIVEIVRSQRRVAQAAGCAFYDQLAAMGGEGSMAAWAVQDPPRAARDRVHLSRDGYAQLGASFVADLLRGYSLYRASKAPAQPAPPQPAPAP